MAVQITSLDEISDTVLDIIKKKFSDKGYRIVDERAKISFGKRKEYFLFSNHFNRVDVEWTFIWIDGNLWQFSYCNTYCGTQSNWVNPLDLLNDLLKK